MINHKSLLLCSLVGLQACTSMNQERINLHDYLQPFIGQSATSIQQQLDLKPLGFQTLAQPQRQNQQLVYTVLRPLRIPIPIAQSTDMNAQNIPIQSAGDASNSYDLNLQCHIIFVLDQQNIARSIQYQGKGC